ncbi:sorting nexin-2-like [Actinia tenebrosa]|uniref:Sorting nexin-2 n=1 Tax=Actinia tenebrosa TaxID=6105 RepID=A0A6P8IA27_ACTTE|nr:sorting nexin-2-like [Actinia tenebrosa]
MADSEAPALFDDEPSPQEETQEPSPNPFGDTTEISLDSDDKEESEPAKVDVEKTEEKQSEEETPDEKSKDEPQGAASVDVTNLSEPEEAPKKEDKPKPKPEEEEEDVEEETDTFDLEIKVMDPEKVGDGMNAYMVYSVITNTSMPEFKSPTTTVKRRFSDFLGLHERLSSKYLHLGRVVPPAPEKSVLGMGKVKFGKEEEKSKEFVDRRKALLERFMNRIAAHPSLRADPDFRQFLEAEMLPRAKDTAALSGGGIKRFVKSVGDTMFNLTTKMSESDQWFEEKQAQIETLDQQLKKLHHNVELLVMNRKELSTTTGSFAKSAAMLSNSEEHTSLSRALTQLAEVEEKIEQLQSQQAETDFFVLSELLKDYIGLIQSVKACFHERVRSYSNWQSAQQTLTKKREALVKIELAGKNEKLPQAQEEVKEWEQKVEKGQEDFEEISKTIRKEMSRFETNRVKDFRQAIITYLEAMMETQQQLIKHWEGFLPEAKAIA